MAQRQRWKSELLVAKSEHPSARPEIFLLLLALLNFILFTWAQMAKLFLNQPIEGSNKN